MPGGGALKHTQKYKVELNIDEYLEKTDPEQKAARQGERIQVLVDSILRWMAEEGRSIDVEDVREDLDQVQVEYMSKVKSGEPLGREEMEKLNRIYNKYNNDS